MTKLDRIIEGADGVTYTVIVYNSTHALLSYETERGTNFLVAEEITEDENNAYTCKSARNFGENILQAVQYMEQAEPKNQSLREVSA